MNNIKYNSKNIIVHSFDNNNFNFNLHIVLIK